MVSSLDPYSKVIALTQGLINKTLKDLKAAYPNLPPFKHDDELAKIRLDIGAPEISIKNEEKFHLTIPMNGTIEIISLKQKATLTNWTVVQEFDISKLSSISGKDNYKRPNLSIERVYTILLSLVEDGYNPDLVESKCAESPKAGAQRISLQDWFSKNPSFKGPLLDIFKQWPVKMRDRGFNAAGLQVKIAAPSIATSEKLLDIGAEYEATKPFIYPSKPTDTTAAGLNSILICGNDTQSPTPTPKSGPNTTNLSLNFSKQSLSPFTQAFESGLFMLSYENLLEHIVLPELVILNEAAELTIALPKREEWGTDKASYEPVYGLKRDFVGDKEVLPASSDKCRFERVERVGGEMMYKWASKNEALVETKEGTAECPRQVFSTSSSHTNSITWKAGEDFLLLSYSIIWSMSSKRGEDPSKPSSELSFSEVTTYTLRINLTSLNGTLTLLFSTPSTTTIPGTKNFTTISTNLIALGPTKLHERRFSSNFGKFVENSLRPSIDAAIARVQNKFEKSFSWGLPENRWFKFQYPTLSARGDFLVEITWLLPRDKDLFDAATLLEDRPVVKPDTGPKPVARTNDLLLTWTLEKSGNAQLTLTGTNTTDTPINLAKLDLSFLCGPPHLIPKLEYQKKPTPNKLPGNGVGFVSVIIPLGAGVDISSKDYVRWVVGVKMKGNLVVLEENEENEGIEVMIEWAGEMEGSGKGEQEVGIEESVRGEGGEFWGKHAGWASITGS